jgi:protoporphyrinogen oxidase
MSRLVILGAGAMGLAAAHRAVTLGHEVTLIEASAEIGGMAAHFDFGGLSLERFYHFLCKADAPTFALLEELGIEDKVRWVGTSMGNFAGGKLHRWGDPLALLVYPHLNPIEKLRYGVMMFLQTKRTDWAALENLSAKRWVEQWCGHSVYDKLWRPLFDLKFHRFANNISAAWIWTRIKRVGTSRRSLFQEELGYIDGGSQTLVNALEAEIRAKGGRIVTASPASEVCTKNGRVVGVNAGGTLYPADAVISTVPTPFIAKLVPALPASLKAAYDAIPNIGVVCVVMKLKRRVSPHFWVNILDPGQPIPGIIEFSNLRPLGDTIVYAPYYMPTDHPNWDRAESVFVGEVLNTLKRLNPNLVDGDMIEARAARLRYAQPVCAPGFAAQIPPIQTPIEGLQVADTCFYYPEDRGIAESVRVGREMAERAIV